MSDHRAPRPARLRTIGRVGAVITGGVLAVSGIAAGTAFADEDHGVSDAITTDMNAHFIPTSPVDGVANHWMQFHYQEENFAGDEFGRITSDPKRYYEIHGEMAKEMVGQGGHEGGHGGDKTYGKTDKSGKTDKGGKSGPTPY